MSVNNCLGCLEGCLGSVDIGEASYSMVLADDLDGNGRYMKNDCFILEGNFQLLQAGFVGLNHNWQLILPRNECYLPSIEDLERASWWQWIYCKVNANFIASQLLLN